MMENDILRFKDKVRRYLLDTDLLKDNIHRYQTIQIMINKANIVKDIECEVNISGRRYILCFKGGVATCRGDATFTWKDPGKLVNYAKEGRFHVRYWNNKNNDYHPTRPDKADREFGMGELIEARAHAKRKIQEWNNVELMDIETNQLLMTYELKNIAAYYKELEEEVLRDMYRELEYTEETIEEYITKHRRDNKKVYWKSDKGRNEDE